MIDFNLFPTDSNGIKQFGWSGPKAAKEAWDKVKNNFDPFKLEGKSKKKSKTRKVGSGNSRKQFISKIIRQVVGRDLLNYAQQAGSCVSEGARTSCNGLAATNVLLLNKPEKFKESYAPFHYSTMRTLIGPKHGTRFGCNDDGGIGSYMAEAFGEYGNLFKDTDGLPDYTGQASIARQWGCYQPKKEYIELAKQHLIKKVARLRSWEDMVDAMTNGYPVHFCSMLSFQMQPNSQGFHEQTREGWAHCMAFLDIDDEWKDPYVHIMNSWGANAHGQLYDVYDKTPLALGMIRARKSVIARALEDDDVEAFALSDMDGFYERKKEIDKALFDLFGN